MACLEHGSDLDRERLAARIALVGANARALALHGADTLGLTATRAHRAVGPKACLNEPICLGFVVIVRLTQNGHSSRSPYGLNVARGYAKCNMPNGEIECSPRSRLPPNFS